LALVLAASFSATAASNDSRGQGLENYTVEHFLKREGVTHVAFSPSGRVATERSKPLAKVDAVESTFAGCGESRDAGNHHEVGRTDVDWQRAQRHGRQERE
jgi:hypothetical protein